MNQPSGNRPQWRQRLSRVLLTALLALGVTVSATVAVVVNTPDVAHAVVASGSRTLTYTGGTAYAGWRDSDDYHNLSVTPTSIASNKCAITAYDWKRLAGHYDVRMTRSCVNGSFRSSGDRWEPAGYGLSGMQKVGNCVGGLGAETSGTCWTQPDSESSITSISLATMCGRKWSTLPNGSFFYESGGNVDSCSS